jgi:hypothetical protein
MITTATRGEADPAAKANAEDELILQEMRERFLQWQQQDAEFLKNSDEELEFAAGDHWRDQENNRDVRAELQSKGRSAFTIDLINPSIELVVNPFRINKPTAKFMLVGDDDQSKTSTQRKADMEVRQGLYRNIDRESNAPVARETAYDYSVRVGRGYYQILIEDDPGVNFYKRIKIQRIDDLHTVAIDQTGVEPDYSDAEWGMIWDDLSVRDFRSQYGQEPDITGNDLPEPDRPTWFKSDKVRRVVYSRRLWFTQTIAKLPPGTLGKDGKPMKFCKIEELPAGMVPVSTMKKRDYKIQRFEATGSQILNRMDWPGRWIPIVVVVGREVFRGRKPKIHSGMIRPAMDVSRVHDYMESRLVDEVALSPLPHLFAASGQLDPQQERIVNEINIHPWAVVTYTAKNAPDGTPLPRPEWVSPSPNIAAVVQGAAHAKDNLQRVLNTYSPQLGHIQGDQSGRAIREVKDQGDTSHAAFPDNANRALLHEARIVNDLMDKVYNEAQAVTITEPDDTTRQVLINQKYTDENGEEQHHLFGASKYDVAIGTEQSYPTRMAEASDKLLDMAKVIPALPVRAPDLLIQAIGLPGTLGQKLSDRLRPPDVDDKNPLPPAAQAKLMQAQTIIQHLTQALNETSEIIKQKRLELGSAERQTMMKAAATLIAADFKYGSEEAQQKFQAALQIFAARTAELDQSPETANPEPQPQPGAQPAPQPQAQPAPAPQAMPQPPAAFPAQGAPPQ